MSGRMHGKHAIVRAGCLEVHEKELQAMESTSRSPVTLLMQASTAAVPELALCLPLLNYRSLLHNGSVTQLAEFVRTAPVRRGWYRNGAVVGASLVPLRALYWSTHSLAWGWTAAHLGQDRHAGRVGLTAAAVATVETAVDCPVEAKRTWGALVQYAPHTAAARVRPAWYAAWSCLWLRNLVFTSVFMSTTLASASWSEDRGGWLYSVAAAAAAGVVAAAATQPLDTVKSRIQLGMTPIPQAYRTRPLTFLLWSPAARRGTGARCAAGAIAMLCGTLAMYAWAIPVAQTASSTA